MLLMKIFRIYFAFMWIGLRRSEMVTGVTAPQKRKHTQKDKKIDISLDCAYTSTSSAYFLPFSIKLSII